MSEPIVHPLAELRAQVRELTRKVELYEQLLFGVEATRRERSAEDLLRAECLRLKSLLSDRVRPAPLRESPGAEPKTGCLCGTRGKNN